MIITPGSNSEALTAHINHLTLRHLSASHIADRRRAVARLGEFIEGDPAHATAEEVLAYIPTIRRSTARSLYCEISHIVQFAKWCVVHGYRTDDPTVRIPKPKLPRLLPRPISEDNLLLAINNADRRMRIILVLAAFAGLRACEIARLHRTDILDGAAVPSLIAHGKGDKDRVVPLCDVVITELKRYGIPPRGPLFPRLDGKPGAWRPQRVSSVANLYLHSVGVPDTLHSLRHRAATGWMQHSGDLLVVAHLLGHDNPSTTMGYAAYNNEAGYRAVQALGSGPERKAG